MRRFLYFIPGLSGLNARHLGNLGLLDRFTGAGGSPIEHCVTAVQEGQGGPLGKGHGCIVAAGTQPPTLPALCPLPSGVSPWIEGKTFCVAFEDPQLPPRPADLERELGLQGDLLTLADGLAWRVPVVRRWDPLRLEHASNLPRTLRPNFSEGGSEGRTTFTAAVRAEFAAIDALADRVFRAFCQGATMPLDQACADAVQLLAANYRIGPEEAGLLGLFDEQTIVRALALSIDYAAIQAQANEWAMDGLHAAEPQINEE